VFEEAIWCAMGRSAPSSVVLDTVIGRETRCLSPVLHAPQLGLLFIRYQTGTLWLLFGGGGRRGLGPQS
jgi:hypothetical protein